MNLTELQENIQIIFDKEESDLMKKCSSVNFESVEDGIIYKNAELIIQMYFDFLNSKDTAYTFHPSNIRSILRNKIVNCDEILHHALLNKKVVAYSVGCSPLCFYTLIKVGQVDEALECLKLRKKTCNGIFSLLVKMLDMEGFNEKQLRELANILKNHKEDNEAAVREKLLDVRYKQLENKVKKTNIEINQDKKSLSEKIANLGFNENFNELLRSIDDFILAESSKVVTAGMISTLRTFMADLMKDIANKIVRKEGSSIPHLADRGEMGDIRAFLKGKLELTDDDNAFITKFVDILHEEGGHSFMSEKEYFRLSRNIAIEIALFVMSKYEKKYGSSS